MIINTLWSRGARSGEET